MAFHWVRHSLAFLRWEVMSRILLAVSRIATAAPYRHSYLITIRSERLPDRNSRSTTELGTFASVPLLTPAASAISCPDWFAFKLFSFHFVQAASSPSLLLLTCLASDGLMIKTGLGIFMLRRLNRFSLEVGILAAIRFDPAFWGVIHAMASKHQKSAGFSSIGNMDHRLTSTLGTLSRVG
jgi:hypothetical protein